MNQAVIGIGSNIEPTVNIPKAINRIAENHRIIRESRLVETEPLAGRQQPNYLNGAILIQTVMDLDELKNWLRTVEDELGRSRTGDRYESRTIDLDIVVWGGTIVDSDVYEREFLKAAIREVCPQLMI
ncbi:MAG: 2-amino-4-hydroxy-6-hydroxymethyldihydropteridine diphosphokinase [Deltaproteobacteria bacterium]|nr:2-amino-4-hydroxy-6-hydroxymethyldihydropteridine diphosphokinase [Deltaproteobacteria bacterium]